MLPEPLTYEPAVAAVTATVMVHGSVVAGCVKLVTLIPPSPTASVPPVYQLREASKLVAAAVIQAAIEDGVNGVEITDPMEAVEAAIWKAEY